MSHDWRESLADNGFKNDPIWRCMRCSRAMTRFADEKTAPKEPIHGLTCEERQVKMVLET